MACPVGNGCRGFNRGNEGRANGNCSYRGQRLAVREGCQDWASAGDDEGGWIRPQGNRKRRGRIHDSSLSAAHMISAADLAPTLKKVDRKLDLLLAYRRIDQAASLERIPAQRSCQPHQGIVASALPDCPLALFAGHDLATLGRRFASSFVLLILVTSSPSSWALRFGLLLITRTPWNMGTGTRRTYNPGIGCLLTRYARCGSVR